MKKLFFIVGCLLVLGSSPVLAQEKADVIIVRVVETFGGRYYFEIARDGKDTETIKAKSGELLSMYQHIAADLINQGYELKGTTATSRGAIETSTLLFVKSAPKP